MHNNVHLETETEIEIDQIYLQFDESRVSFFLFFKHILYSVCTFYVRRTVINKYRKPSNKNELDMLIVFRQPNLGKKYSKTSCYESETMSTATAYGLSLIVKNKQILYDFFQNNETFSI